MTQIETEAPGHDLDAVVIRSRVISYVTESAVMALPVAEGAPPVVCRRQFPGAFVNLDADDGIRAEMRRELRPVPWYSREERDFAAATVRRDLWLSDGDKEAIVRHIEGTPFYEWDKWE